MKPSIQQQEQYWDKTWAGRCDPENPLIVTMNKYKMNYLIHLLSERPYYEKLRKLDVGCGTMIHHGFLSNHYPHWGDGLVGIDLSESAIEKARFFGFDAYCQSLYDFNPSDGFDAFFFMDSLEHFDDLDRVIDNINALGRGDYYIFGNIPLYAETGHAVDGGFENPMDINVLLQFFGALGFHGLWQKIHGSCGYPYMVFEARKSGNIGNNDEGTILLS